MVNSNRKRERKVNLGDLSEEQFINLQKQIGDNLRALIDNTVEKANKILEPYGHKVLMEFNIQKIKE